MAVMGVQAQNVWPPVQSNMYPHIGDMRLVRHEQTVLLGEGNQQTDIFYSTVMKFKGLERHCVVLVVNGFVHPEKARERTLSDFELRTIWTATEGDGDYLRIIRLCALTGCRREEIGGLRWDEVLPDRLLIGAARMKAGNAHEVPILPAITAVLPNRPDDAGGSVFGRNGTGFSGWSKSKQAFDRKLANAGMQMHRWTLHDLRRTFSTRLHDAGVEPLVVEALLAHKQQGVAAVYKRASFREAKRIALSHWHKIFFEIVRSSEAD